ncbi:cupredoxin family copper-binding protein [Streptomyces sp. FH025]|uniref:cupredoxin domain-containing protein n=1 Tax=Streptomyces sp. FH025 TaxID=2815937 RepID=UPI001A9F4E3E|nr:cupredoxin family copper-binding protein [Streptomyces sp. FH025]MBO1415080.1 cupredoxin family copper-binding protein [Streptomyces sp. FH025]
MTERSRRQTKSNDHARRRIARPLVAAAVAAGLGALGAWSPAAAPSQGVAATAVSQTVLTSAPRALAAATQSVTIANFAFSPGTLTVSKGTTVTWTNNDTDTHTVTSSGGGPLNSSPLAKGASYSYTFTTAGTFAYICSIHPFMHGTVVVQ